MDISFSALTDVNYPMKQNNEVIPIGITPNGVNINKDCGSTATALMAKTVVESGADLGIALDGDADRLIMCDENGTIIDGDQLLGLIATSWQKNGLLSKPGIVATGLNLLYVLWPRGMICPRLTA